MLFQSMLEQVGEDVTRVLMNVQIQQQPQGEVEAPAQQQEIPQENASQEPQEDIFAHVGRNDPCPCGSGKRFKDCHGKLN